MVFPFSLTKTNNSCPTSQEVCLFSSTETNNSRLQLHWKFVFSHPPNPTTLVQTADGRFYFLIDRDQQISSNFTWSFSFLVHQKPTTLIPLPCKFLFVLVDENQPRSSNFLGGLCIFSSTQTNYFCSFNLFFLLWFFLLVLSNQFLRFPSFFFVKIFTNWQILQKGFFFFLKACKLPYFEAKKKSWIHHI